MMIKRDKDKIVKKPVNPLSNPGTELNKMGNEDICSVTTCDNRYEYLMIRIPRNAKRVEINYHFCKDCLLSYLGGNNINYNTEYKIYRRVLSFERKNKKDES